MEPNQLRVIAPRVGRHGTLRMRTADGRFPSSSSRVLQTLESREDAERMLDLSRVVRIPGRRHRGSQPGAMGHHRAVKVSTTRGQAEPRPSPGPSAARYMSPRLIGMPRWRATRPGWAG